MATAAASAAATQGISVGGASAPAGASAPVAVVRDRTGERLVLGPPDFLAEGGQGRVFARGDTAFKIYHQPAALPPPDKLRFLAGLRAPGLVAPGDLLRDAGGRPVGFCLPFLRDAHPLDRAGTEAFRQRHNLGPTRALALVDQMRATVLAVHRQGARVVDLNPLNLLLDAELDAVHFIDLDAWQVPGHPAGALLDSVRDRHGPRCPHTGAPRFDAGTDWFSFAVTAFGFLVGLHPYKGAHPSLKGLDARMAADCSVFDPSVRRPPSARDPDRLPRPARDWFRAVFQDRFRGPPPAFAPTSAPTSTLGLVASRATGLGVGGPSSLAVGGPSSPPTSAPALSAPGDAGEVAVQRLYTVPEAPDADATLQGVLEGDEARLALSPDGVWIEHRRAVDRRSPGAPKGALALAHLGPSRRPVLAWVEAGRVQVQDLDSGQRWGCDLAARAVVGHAGTLYALGADAVVALRGVGDAGGGVVAPRVVARVRPQGSALFEGVVLQRVPGARLATVFVAPERALTVALPALADGEVIAAQAAGPVLVVVVRCGDRLDRHLGRLDVHGGPPDLQVTRGVDFAEATLAVLPSGLAVLQTAPDALTLFPAAPGAPGERTLQAPALAGLSGLLTLPGGALGARIGPHLARLRVR